MTPIQTARLLGAALLALALSACSTSLTAMHSARVLDAGQTQFTGALAVPIATSAIEGAIDLGDAAVDEAQAAAAADTPLAEDDQRDLTTAALALALFQPALVPELVARVGVGYDLDLGLRLSGQLVKADAQWQLWAGEDRSAASLTLGLAHHFGPGASALEPLFKVLEFVKLDDFSRLDLDLALMTSAEFDDWLIFYGGARYLASFITLDANIPDIETAADVEIIKIDNTIHHVGLTGGLMLGYKFIFLNLELTAVQALFKPDVLGEPRDLDGLILVPSLGLTLRL